MILITRKPEADYQRRARALFKRSPHRAYQLLCDDMLIRIVELQSQNITLTEKMHTYTQQQLRKSTSRSRR